jgi:hypothetical protein
MNKYIILAIVFLVGVFIYIFFMTNKKIEGFSQVPINEIAQVLRGGDSVDYGMDIKSIVQKYPHYPYQSDIIHDIDLASYAISSIQTSCSQGNCKNVPVSAFQTIQPQLLKVINEIATMTTSSLISKTDQTQLQANLQIISGMNQLILDIPIITPSGTPSAVPFTPSGTSPSAVPFTPSGTTPSGTPSGTSPSSTITPIYV